MWASRMTCGPNSSAPTRCGCSGWTSQARFRAQRPRHRPHQREGAHVSDTNVHAPDALVIFGITGDLAHKMTFGALYRLEAAGRLDCPIVGVASDQWSQDQLVAAIRKALQETGHTV